MKIIFFGTPDFSAEILKFLFEKGVLISAVVTQPDKVQGRRLLYQESPVKQMARTLMPNTPILQPDRISDDAFFHALASIEADLFVVVAFGQIFPKSLLDKPRLGCVNVHTSLLPKYRGAAPIQRCLINGETETGSTIMFMAEKCDAGDILAVEKVPILPDMTAGELSQVLCETSKDLLYQTLIQLFEGRATAKSQNIKEVTFAKKVTPQTAEMLWNEKAQTLYNLFRGVTPKPGAWCWIFIKGKKFRLKLHAIEIVDLQGEFPGEILYDKKEGLVVSCQDKALALKVIQLEGKKALSAHSFMRGFSLNDLSFSKSASSSC